MRFDPKGVSVVVVEDHDPGVAAGEDVLAVDAEDELLEEGLGGLVAAVLGPCLAEGLELGVGGLPALFDVVLADGLHLLGGETEAQGLGDLDEFLLGGVADADVAEVVGCVPADHAVGSGHAFTP